MVKQIKFYFRFFKSTIRRTLFNNTSTQRTFTQIHSTNKWGDNESVSGSGSNLEQTANLLNILPEIFKKYDIKSILDIPCGDFNWMKNVNLESVRYIGADIVEPIISRNQQKYAKDGIEFRVLDLTKDELPTTDLIFCRDCLVHLSYEHINKALANIKKSKSKYLLTTTFVETGRNYDIATGDWRPLNLIKSPFSLSSPLEVINEGYFKIGEESADKSLLLYEIKVI